MSMLESDEEPIFESGKIFLRSGSLKLLQVQITSKTIDVNLEDKELIRRALKFRSTSSPAPNETEKKKQKTSSSSLQTLRTLAEALSSRGITLTISYQGSRLITIGADANSTLLQMVTKTRKVAINNVIKLAQMVS